jgi:hypothetical protein
MRFGLLLSLQRQDKGKDFQRGEVSGFCSAIEIPFKLERLASLPIITLAGIITSRKSGGSRRQRRRKGGTSSCSKLLKGYFVL